jgi:hypothetical protein
MEETTYQGSTHLGRLRMPALAVGVLGLIACAAGFFLDHDQFFRSWLYGFIFWIAIALGALGLLMIQFLTGGAWGVLIRRNLEAAVRTLPLMALAFIPIALGLHSIFEWTHDEVVAKDPILAQKVFYLNEPFFLLRAVIYFALWIGLAFTLNHFSKEHERTESLAVALRLRRVSAAGLVIMGLTLTLASVDWMMSLEPHWFSTMYGISFMVACLLGGMSVAVIALSQNASRPPVSVVAKPIHFRDLGNLMLAFVMLWAYTGFSQFLLIWYGNIREEIPWYLKRSQGPWLWIATTLLILHFFVPFFLLLNRPVKERTKRLAMVMYLVVVMRALDLFWLIKPAFTGNDFEVHWLDAAALIGIGGIWVAIFVGSLAKRPLVPGHETMVRSALSREVLTHG